jgi:cytochrome c-type biogenesis protein CcmH
MSRGLRRCALPVALACLLQCGVSIATAGEAEPLAGDPVLESRMLHLAEELRCLVCQNQTIADSHAALALDLKAQIREQLGAGRSDAQVLAYMVERYGDFVLYRPPLKATTAALWIGPFALLALGAGIAVAVVRRRRTGSDAIVLSDSQRQRAAAMLADEPEPRSP